MTDDSQQKVVLTRKRWDAYFLPLFVLAICVGAFLVWQTGQLRFAVSPLGVLPIWLMLRFTTPPDGMSVTTIRSTPGAVTMLWCCGVALTLFAALLAIDIYVIGHPFRAPLEPYHFLLFSPPFVIMIGGGFVVDRIQKASSRRDS